MKKSLSIVLSLAIVVMLLAMAMPAFAGPATTISIGSATVQAGQTTTLVITIQTERSKDRWCCGGDYLLFDFAYFPRFAGS